MPCPSPPEKRPKTRDEWTAYTDFALVLDRVSFSKVHTLWLRDLARLGWIAARQKIAALHASPSDLLEMDDLMNEIVGAIGEQLLPNIAGYQEEDNPQWQQVMEAVANLYFETSILKQLRASLRWHELQLLPRVEDEPAEDKEAPPDAAPRLDHWPTPLAAPYKVGKLYAHFLSTTAQLHDEGLRMEHCVGVYTSQCLFNGSNIVSLRTGDGRSVSTAELRLVYRAKNLGFEVVQHKAQHNANPSPEATQALDRLIARLETDGMQEQLQDMLEQLKIRQRMDNIRQQWKHESPLAPHRLRCLKAALKLHVGYDRFLDAGRKALEA